MRSVGISRAREEGERAGERGVRVRSAGCFLRVKSGLWKGQELLLFGVFDT